MTVRVSNVEVALAPFCVARRGLGIKTSRERPIIERVDIGDTEYDPSPPDQTLAGRPGDKIEKSSASMKAGEERLRSAVLQAEAERFIKSDRPAHIAGDERDGADALDHGQPLVFRAGLGRLPGAFRA